MDEDLKRIAARIRRWRDEADLTLQQLGDRSGVSASTIHKIENLQTVPTIAVLLKISNGLNRRPSELLSESNAEKQVAVLREGDRQLLKMNEDTKMEHLVGMIPRNRLDVWRVHVLAGRGVGRPGTDPWRFKGEVVILVEDGCIECVIESDEYLLEAGDSIHFDANQTHSWVAGQEKPATVLVFAMIPARLQADLVGRMAKATATETKDGDEDKVVAAIAADPTTALQVAAPDPT